jgi:hypothetical protein
MIRDTTTGAWCNACEASIRAARAFGWSWLYENAMDEASRWAVAAVAADAQRDDLLGEGPAPYAFIPGISGSAPRILIARFSVRL